jgi:hypothetical protein
MPEAFTWLEFLKYLLSILLGAAATGIPLWYKIRQINLKMAEGGIKIEGQKLKLDRKDEEAREELDQQKKINAEAEWKRIIEFRDAELVRLRERDDQQERQLMELWNKHIECQRNESAQAEKIKGQDARIEANEKQIAAMQKQLGELLGALIAQQNPKKE